MANGPGALSPDKQQTAATATWVDRREQYVERTPGNAPPTERPAIADPTLADDPNRLVALSPPLTKGVRTPGRSWVTLRLSAGTTRRTSAARRRSRAPRGRS